MSRSLPEKSIHGQLPEVADTVEDCLRPLRVGNGIGNHDANDDERYDRYEVRH